MALKKKKKSERMYCSIMLSIYKQLYGLVGVEELAVLAGFHVLLYCSLADDEIKNSPSILALKKKICYHCQLQ